MWATAFKSGNNECLVEFVHGWPLSDFLAYLDAMLFPLLHKHRTFTSIGLVILAVISWWFRISTLFPDIEEFKSTQSQVLVRKYILKVTII